MKTKVKQFFFVQLLTLFLVILLFESCNYHYHYCPDTWDFYRDVQNNTTSLGYVIAVCHAGKIFKDSLFCDITQIPSGTSEDLNDVTEFLDNTNICYVVGNSGTILKSTTCGVSWFSQNSNTTNNLNSVAFCSHSTGYVSGDLGTVLKTTNGGDNWQTLSTSITVNLNEIVVFGCSVIKVFGDDLTGYISTNGGSSWTQMPISGGDLQGRMPDLEASFFLDSVYSNSLIGYVVGENFVVKTTNGGANWSMRSLYPPAYFAHVVYFSSPDSGIIMGDRGSVFYTTNGGANWTLDDSASSITSKTIRGYSIIDTNVAAIVGDSLFMYVSTDSIITGIGNKYTGSAISFLLSQNYPNPFNPVTNIGYEIPVKSNVKLSVYDINGRLIRILVNEVKNRGEYFVAFNAGDIPSGVYFYKIEARAVHSSECFAETKKMLLIK